MLASIVTFLFLAMAVYFATKHSIFYWGAKTCILLDAAMLCTWEVLGLAVAKWRQRIGGTIREVNLEVTKLEVTKDGR